MLCQETWGQCISFIAYGILNIGNIKLNEELGFQVEGILRNEVYFDDQYHDILRMGMLIEE